MALLRCDVTSEVLRVDTSITVILPQDHGTPFSPEPLAFDDAPPVLYLLHGLGDDDSAWVRFTAIERYVRPLGLAVVMPQVGRSFYADQVHGNRYWTYLADELPALVGAMFHVSQRREDTYVAGLSMGGFGAMKLALLHPERFAAAASLSGALDLAEVRRRREPHRESTLLASFGPGELHGTDDDLLHLLRLRSSEGASLPRLYAGCGAQDALLPFTQIFVEVAQQLGVDITAEVVAGEHDWAYWDAAIQRVLAWLPIPSRGAGSGSL